jgi:putative Mg2+ transporter-C (MgtC) family protein
MDLMRLPLGILTGVGFLGGGAILKKGGSITGVTTAATLWIATVIGLCIGGGQLGLGAVSTALGLFTLWGMHWFDKRIRREHSGLLVVATAPGSPRPGIEALLRPLGREGLRQPRRRVRRQGPIRSRDPNANGSFVEIRRGVNREQVASEAIREP